MKKLIFILAISALAFAQKSSTPPSIDTCKLGSHHNCRCSDRYHAIQQKVILECQLNSKTDKELADCIASVPFYCEVIDRVRGEDADGFRWNSETHEYSGHSPMGELCTGACKLHDCACFDGPACHFGHSASEHMAPKRK